MLRFYLEGIAVAHQKQVALTVGGRLTGYDIHVSMPVPPHHARYFGLSPARLHFDERAVPGVRVVMDSELLDAPLPMASARVVGTSRIAWTPSAHEHRRPKARGASS